MFIYDWIRLKICSRYVQHVEKVRNFNFNRCLTRSHVCNDWRRDATDWATDRVFNRKKPRFFSKEAVLKQHHCEPPIKNEKCLTVVKSLIALITWRST